MKVGTRIVFSLFIIVILAACAAIIVSALGFVDIQHAQGLMNGFLYSDYKYIWAGAAAVLFVAGVALLFFGTKKAEPETVELLQTAECSVSITLAAIEELAARYLAGITGVLVQKIAVHAVSAGVIKVVLHLCVKPGVEIPGVTEQIRKEAAEYIDKFSGLTVNNVEIRIMPLKNTASAGK